MTAAPFPSYAQNREDVVVHRALCAVSRGRYVDVGANDPTIDSVTRAFYDSGWSGVLVEPVRSYAERLRAERPGDIVVEAAVTDADAETVVLHQFVGTGLSTLDDGIAAVHSVAGQVGEDVAVPARRLDAVLAEAGWKGLDIHFMNVDVEGAEHAVLASNDWTTYRPWVVVVEATRPNSTEPAFADWEPVLISAGYRFCLFDGLSRFYVAKEHAEALEERLSYPACALDDYSTPESRHVDGLAARAAALGAERDRLVSAVAGVLEGAAASAARAQEAGERAMAMVVHWRTRAVRTWACDTAGGDLGGSASEMGHLQNNIPALLAQREAMMRSVSWRVTRPLRVVRRFVPRRGVR